MFHNTPHSFFLRISGALIALMLLISACNMPTSGSNPVPTAAQSDPAATVVSPATAPTATNAPAVEPTAAAPEQQAAPTQAAPTDQAAPTQAAYPAQAAGPTQAASTDAAASYPAPAGNSVQNAPSVTVNVSGVAQSVDTQVVAAVSQAAAVPWYQVMPEHTVLTLQGYPVANHKKQPQIFVYPVQGLSTNQKAAEEMQRVQQLLQNQPTGEAISLPYLPPEPSAKQIVHHVVKYLDFKNGKGMRYLTQWANGLVPVNNQELVYTFQGLTSDGKYYVAAVLPVNLQGLPADANDTTRLPTGFPDNYTGYLADTISLLEQNPASAYTPDLTALDAMMQSIEIK